jgi:oligopeptidase B
MLEDVDLFASFFVACEREDGLPRLRCGAFPGTAQRRASPAKSPSLSRPTARIPHINRVFDATTFRYAYQSLVTPSSVYEYDVATRSIRRC